MFDTIIVGGGPVGLFLACELRLAGANPVVLERLPGASQADKAHGLTGQVVRLMDHRGLYERCGGSAPPMPAPQFFFGGLTLPLDVLGADNPMYLLRINQRDLEGVLGERAAELGVDVRRGYEVRSFSQVQDHVAVVVTGEDGSETTFHARYVVGCDGARSVIRKQSGIGFPGFTDPHVVDRSALVGPIEHVHPRPGGRIAIDGLGEVPASFYRTERGVLTIGGSPQQPIIHTMEWEDQPAGTYPGPGSPMTMAEMEDSIERVIGVRIALTEPADGSPTLSRRLCGRNTRLADRYRDRRVFLAGDAAHVHSAAGGPGLNLALQDAANLAWKLAAELHGWAPTDLLDTYESERHAIGERVFMQTQAQTALMAPGSNVTALRELFTELLGQRENVQQIADLIAASDIRYDMGDEHPAAPTGRFVPPLELTTEDGRHRHLAELTHHARPLLLDASHGTDLAAAAAPWADRVLRIPADVKDTPAPALLIRPDGYVAWAGSDPVGLQGALTRWFGSAPDDRPAA
ncbi:FAD-dependent monooxygenase [Streptomyces sp. NBC_00859]|uniref:FAD-dependent monooxygenase n=1 Tax=Streptomyces sp. NBC_00859 TaxID=2903682 RepID=UPI00386F41C5|nr:FAD-dependent monooxygenase [Streptomyces sp. NBC_00859]